jgi:hypothetical protein
MGNAVEFNPHDWCNNEYSVTLYLWRYVYADMFKTNRYT